MSAKSLCYDTAKILCKNGHSYKDKYVFQDRLSLNAGQKYCILLQREHSAMLLAFIELPVVIKTFVLSFFEWLFYTGFTVYQLNYINTLVKSNK